METIRSKRLMRIVGIILVAAVFFVAGAMLFMERPAPAEGPAIVVTITYTDDGYAPREVTIKKGGTVRWLNESGVDMWPASAVHPTHSLYPEKSESDCLGSSFDACEEMPPGSAWEFTFREVGDWKFHDHIRPSHTGAVHVTK